MKGEIVPQGAKNEALQILCATLLTPEKIHISNIPEIVDVMRLVDLLKDLGVEVVRLKEGEFTFEAKNVRLDFMDTPEFKKQATSLRGSAPDSVRHGRPRAQGRGAAQRQCPPGGRTGGEVPLPRGAGAGPVPLSLAAGWAAHRPDGAGAGLPHGLHGRR